MTSPEKRIPSEDQSEAIRFASGPCQIIAGPGSGKTFVLVEHITYLIESLHISPSSILVLTFSKAAALEMQTRFQERTSSAYPDVTFGTFHSVFYHILRLSSPGPVKVADAASRNTYLQQLIQEYYDKEGDRPSLDMLSSEISRYKSAAGRNFTASLSFPCPELLPRILRDYNRFLKENNMLDYDDMISDCLHLFRTDKRALAAWQERFSHILVDEFQDINPGQYSVIRLLGAKSGNLYTVGDDDQSIYGFRGSNPACMKWFRTDFPACRTIFLSVNFRSGKTIVAAAGKVIRENRIRFPKKIRSGRAEAGSFSVRAFENTDAQYREIGQRILSMAPDERRNTAVICRNHAQVRAFSGALDRLCGSDALLDRDPFFAMVWGDIAAYFRFALRLGKGQGDRGDLFRIMNRPMRYLSRESFRSEKLTADQLYAGAGRGGIPSRRMERLLEDLRILSRVRPAIGIRYLLETMEYKSWLLDQYPEKDRERLEALMNKASKEASGLQSAEEVPALLEKGIREASMDRQEEDREVAVMTMHASKGLEFDTVFLPDLNEGILPGRRSIADSDIEEERRLFYVAMTRARERLCLSYVTGSGESRERPSRFLLPLGVRKS